MQIISNITYWIEAHPATSSSLATIIGAVATFAPLIYLIFENIKINNIKKLNRLAEKNYITKCLAPEFEKLRVEITDFIFFVGENKFKVYQDSISKNGADVFLPIFELSILENALSLDFIDIYGKEGLEKKEKLLTLLELLRITNGLNLNRTRPNLEQIPEKLKRIDERLIELESLKL